MAAFDIFEEEDVLPVLEVRVVDATKKPSFRVRRLTNFPPAETVEEMKSALQIFMPDLKNVDNCKIGYVLDRNKKYSIETNVELQDAFQHLRNGYQMWLDPSPSKSTAKKQHRSKVSGK
jgi:hypothetical protein